MFRNQWAGITDAPRTYYLSVDGPVWGDRMGIGGSVFNDVAGAISKAGLQLIYAYHLKLTPDISSALHLAGSIFKWSANGAEMNLENAQDIAISNGNMSALDSRFWCWSALFSQEVSCGILHPSDYELQDSVVSDYNAELSELKRHYYLNLGLSP